MSYERFISNTCVFAETLCVLSLPRLSSLLSQVAVHIQVWSAAWQPEVGKIIVKTRDPAPTQAGLQANEPPSGVLQVPRAPSH